MGKFILRRLFVIGPMLIVVVSLTWGLIRLAPGNFYSGEKRLPPAIEKNIREKYGLDKPWYVQYGRMLSNTEPAGAMPPLEKAYSEPARPANAPANASAWMRRAATSMPEELARSAESRLPRSA